MSKQEFPGPWLLKETCFSSSSEQISILNTFFFPDRYLNRGQDQREKLFCLVGLASLLLRHCSCPRVQGIIHPGNSLETKIWLNSMNRARKGFWIQTWMSFVQKRWWLQMQYWAWISGMHDLCWKLEIDFYLLFQWRLWSWQKQLVYWQERDISWAAPYVSVFECPCAPYWIRTAEQVNRY